MECQQQAQRQSEDLKSGWVDRRDSLQCFHLPLLFTSSLNNSGGEFLIINRPDLANEWNVAPGATE